jgi:hypothetical protein
MGNEKEVSVPSGMSPIDVLLVAYPDRNFAQIIAAMERKG